MVEFVWQANVVKFIGVVGCLVVGVIAFCSLAIAKSPQGADDESLSSLNWLAVWIVRVVVGVLLLVVAGTFYEREALTEKIPRIPREGWASWIVQRGVLFVVPFFVPVVHLLFTMSVLIYGIGMILVRTEDPLLKLIFLACWNGCCYLGMSFVMLWAGPTEDYGPARVITSFYAGFGGTLLPSMAALASATDIAVLLRISISLYAVAALHAATVIMQAVGNYLYQIVDDIDPVYSTDACMPALESIFGTLMNGTAEFLTERYGTSSIETDDDVVNSCPVIEDTSTQPCDPIKWYVILTGALLGLWVTGIAVVCLLMQQKARVAPMNAPPIRKQRAQKRARNLLMAKIGAALAMLIVGGGIGVPGYFTFWVCPDEGWVEETEAIFWNTTISTTVTSTTYTSTSTTYTSTTTTTGSSTTRTTTSTTRTTTVTTTTRTLAATGDTSTDTSTDTSNTTAAPTNTTVADPCEDVELVVETVLARDGCHCGESPARPWWAWTAVPSEQVASVWCSLGNGAPVILFTFLYIFDCYICSLLYEQLGVHLVQEEQHRFQQRQERMRRHAFETGSTMERARQATATESRIKVWQESDREPVPRPVAGHGTERLFDI